MFTAPVFILYLALLSAATGAEISSPGGSPSPWLPPQATPVQGVLVPVPSEIFGSLDKFQGANWRAVQRPEIVRWKSHGDQVQTAVLLGVVVAEGFVAMEAEDSTELNKIAERVLNLSRALGVERTALRRSRSIMDDADHGDWAGARKEWDGVLSDLEKRMIKLKSEKLSQLVSLAGWLRGTEALCALVHQDYSPEHAALIRQPALLDYLEKQLEVMRVEKESRPTIAKMTEGIRAIRALVQNQSEPPTEQTVRQIGSLCRDLVQLGN